MAGPVLTGFAPNATNPSVPPSPLTLTAEQLPIRLIFNGRTYTIEESTRGGLVMTAPRRVDR